jgi:hypothetical protein
LIVPLFWKAIADINAILWRERPSPQYRRIVEKWYDYEGVMQIRQSVSGCLWLSKPIGNKRLGKLQRSVPPPEKSEL